MLKKLNQRAFAKINSLEAKISDLIHENNLLMKRISEKQYVLATIKLPC